MSGTDVALITGGGGFVGGRLFEALRAAGRDVHAWTRADGDLRDGDRIRAALGRIRPTHIYHLASNPPGPGDESWRRIADEQAMLANLAYAMPAHCRLIYAGSMAEYGRSGVLSEQDQCTPDTGYGCAKLGGTALALSLRNLFDLDIRVARLFGAYGPGEAPNRLLPTLVTKLGRHESVPLSDGAQLRDFVHVDDVSAILMAFADAPGEDVPALSNIGTGQGVTVRHVCERVAAILGADPALLQFGAVPRRAVDQDCLVANVGRMARFASPPPQRWLDEILAEEMVRAMVGDGIA